MGRRYRPKCEICSYQGFATVGSGMRDHKTISRFPVLCRECETLTHINERDADPKCDKCSGYDYVKYGADTREANASGQGELEGMHQCPQCKSHTLVFGWPILFD